MSRKEPLRTIKGMRDILPPESALWNRIEKASREVFTAYNYQEIRTPLVEPTELFARGVGQDTDIVTKEMYSFDDRDGQSLTLRPEATASVVRSYIEHRMWEQPGGKKFYYIGPMFRRERPQKGRYRQFYQIGAEAIGSESPGVDAEMIEMLAVLLDLLGLKGYTLLLNSVGCRSCRPSYLAKLREALAEVRDQLCDDCRRRSETNPLRVLDCKVPADQTVIDQLPTLASLLCVTCATHFDQLQDYLRNGRIAFTLRPRLVRGLDYYTRTTFEFIYSPFDHISDPNVKGVVEAFPYPEYVRRTVQELAAKVTLLEKETRDILDANPHLFRKVAKAGDDVYILQLGLGAQNSLLGGGRYDNLSEDLGSGRHTPGIGFSIGEDRLVLILQEVMGDSAEAEPSATSLFIIWLGENAYRCAAQLARELRARNVAVELLADAVKLKKALELASRLGVRYALLIGDQELAEGKYPLRDMSQGTQVSVTKEELFEQFAGKDPKE